MSDAPLPLSKLRHDLRTPINHILGYSELLQEDLSDRGVEELQDLDKIRGAAKKLLELIEANLGDATLSPVQETRSDTAPRASRAPEASPPQPAPIPGKILVVDDDDGNRETLARRLRREGHTVQEAGHGIAALEALARAPFDLVLLDLMMPEMDGFTALSRMKSEEATRHIPVIMISALDELASVIRCIEAGAEDYLPKPFDPTLLRARIGASLEKKTLRDQEQAHLQTIEETQRRLADELKEASRYVASMLPPPEDEPLRIRWMFTTSTELGGDAFGYHWLDDRHYALYLLDVCGHGVGAALLSVAASNFLRSKALPGVDFCSPAAVLTALNETFQMDRHDNMYFTIWYGVFDTATRELRHAAGGHPPALLLLPGQAPQPIGAPGMIIGAMPGTAYKEDSVSMPDKARLLVYSDGAYELRLPEGRMLGFEDFVAWAGENAARDNLAEAVFERAKNLTQCRELDDDLSVLAIDFPPEA